MGKGITTTEALLLGAATTGIGYGGYLLYKYFAEEEDAKRTGIHGRVTDLVTGEAIQRALILINRKLNGDFGPTHTAESDDSGYYSITGIEPGEYWCDCSGVGYIFSSTVITVVEDTLSRWDIELEPVAVRTAVLFGTVKDARTEEPLADVYVYILHYLDPGSPQHIIYDTYTDSRGQYRIEDIMVSAAGTEYECNAGTTGYYSYDEPKILYEGGQELNIGLIKLGEAYGTASVRGTITDYDTALPIEGVEVRLYSPGYEGWSYKITFTTITDVNGQYRFENIPGIEYSIHAYLLPDYWPYPVAEITQYITVTEGQELVWDIVLIPYIEPVMATLYGTITDSSTGLPIPGALIWIWDTGIAKSVYANSFGEYEITNLPPWPEYPEYLVNFSKAGYSQVWEEHVVLQSGEWKRLDAQLTPVVTPGKASVHGRVTDAYTGIPLPLAWVFFTEEHDAYYYQTQTDLSGEYRIDDMEALSYEGGCFITTEDAGKPYQLGEPVYITLSIGEDREVNWELVPS